MVTVVLKRLVLSTSLCIIITCSVQASALGNGDKNKGKATYTDNRSGLIVKQRKPNMYVKFFNRVYNKYAKKTEEQKQLPVVVITENKTQSHSSTK